MKRSMKRCKMRKGNGMLLREYLKEWTKEDLLNEARSYELKNCSRLKKDDLIDRIFNDGRGTPGQTFMPDERADGAFLQSLYRATENFCRRDYGWNAVI